MTKSELFTQYNRARAAARQGKLDSKRVNRALGMLQSSQPDHGYQTSIKSCDCIDHQRNPKVACKHMVAKMIETRIEQSKPQAKPEQSSQPEQPKVIYLEMEWDGIDPQNLKSNWEHASHIKVSQGKGLLPINDALDVVEMLTGYEPVKTEYVSKNRWGTVNYKMWWERK